MITYLLENIARITMSLSGLPALSYRAVGQHVGECPELAVKLQVFMVNFFTNLPSEQKGKKHISYLRISDSFFIAVSYCCACFSLCVAAADTAARLKALVCCTPPLPLPGLIQSFPKSPAGC